MLNITFGTIVGILIAFVLMAGVGIYSGRKVKNAEDFTVAGRKASPIMIAGTITGACVGAGGTIGTAETAFKLGIVGWWQTLGLGIGLFVLAFVFAELMYKTQVQTAPQLLEKNYGSTIRPLTAAFSSIAIFLSILSQVKGFLPLLQSTVDISLANAGISAVVLVLLFVVVGGIFATSLGGLLKLGLIYIFMVIGSIIAVKGMNGFSGMRTIFASEPLFFNIFARGVQKDLGVGLSMMLGILVTQTYIQGVLSAKDPKGARDGAILSAIFTIPVGLFGVAIGMYMRANFPDMVAAQALPQFFILKLPAVLSGIAIGSLMLASLGSCAALVLGVGTMISRDIFLRLRPNATEKNKILLIRVIIVVVTVLAGFFAVSKAGELIQTFIFLSFGLRVSVFLVPMAFALLYKGKLTKAAGIASVIAGPIVNIYWSFVKPNDLNPVYVGLGAAFIAFVVANEIAKRMGEAGATDPT